MQASLSQSEEVFYRSHITKYFYFQGDEKKIYEFIVRHFLACCSQDAQGFETTVELSVADELVGLSNSVNNL